MFKIGLTGGIGSGKTTVARIFEVLGIPVYYADDRAKDLMNTDNNLRQQIVTHFGDESYLGKELNRPFIANIVFNDAEKLSLLNSLVHPVTLKDANEWMQAQNTPYAIKEAALFFETDAWKHVDKIIGVHSPFELRMQRTMQRDGASRGAVQARIERQMNEDDKMKRCDFVIMNDEQTLLIPQVLQLHRQFCALAAST